MDGTERVLKSTDKIYDLVDIIDDQDELQFGKAPEVISIDGQVCEKANKTIEGIDPELNVMIIEKVSEIVEKVAREIMPDIAERVLREEIETLRREYDQGEVRTLPNGIDDLG
jgi:glutaredoxin